MAECRYLSVAVPTPVRRSFHYLPPAGVDISALQPGARLRVPFGRRRMTAVFLGLSRDTDVDPAKVRPAEAVLDAVPVLSAPLLELCTWASAYYHHPIGEVAAAALPVLLRQGEPVGEPLAVLTLTATGRGVDSAGLKRAPRQAALLARLQESVDGLTAAEIRQLGIGANVVRAVLAKSLVEWQERGPPQQAPFDPGSLRVADGHIELTAEQRDAIATIQAAANRTSLLFGITGSGKTEVYLQLIAGALRSGRQALVLVPEIGLTPQTIERFTRRFNVPVVAMHSGLTDRERLNAWAAARSGAAGIVIGTRSAIFTPLHRPGLIVVDEEHDASFKQQDGFRYHARDLAVMRGQLERIPVILGSATPSLETWHNANIGKYGRAVLSSRPGDAAPARYRVINIRSTPLTEGFAPELLQAISQELDHGSQVLVFLNRRGFSPVLLCRQCGWIARCHRCDARLTFHRQLGSLVCHHCGSQAKASARCPDCSSDQLVPLGAGTQRIESTLNNLFQSHRIIRIDRDSTRRKHAMGEFMAEVKKGGPAILVGTQLLAKGHHFPDVTLVAIVDMDSGFYSADYRAPERMGQLILQVGGRAGRAQKPGVVTIQTHFPEQPIFRTLIEDGYGTFADKLLAERADHELPPFCYHALIRAEATERSLPMRFLEGVYEKSAPTPSVTLLGPVPSSMERRAGKFRAQLLLSSRSRKLLQQGLDTTIAAGEDSPLSRKVRWSVDVDPVDLF